MDFELTDDQIELQQVVRDITAKECPTTLMRAVVAGDDDAGALWRTYVGLGVGGRPHAVGRHDQPVG